MTTLDQDADPSALPEDAEQEPAAPRRLGILNLPEMTVPEAAAFMADMHRASRLKRSRTINQRRSRPLELLQWAHRYRRIDGRLFTLERFHPLRAIYRDDHPHIVIIKPAQRGASEYAVNLAAYALEWGHLRWAGGMKNGINVGYVFPSDGELRDFAKERLNGLKDESEHLQALFGGATFESITFKQVGQSFLYLRGSVSENTLRSWAADLLILDEYDRIPPGSVALARRRMNASMIRREVDLSTPTLPGKGIDGEYMLSDQQIYEQECPACQSWNTYDFWRDVWVDDKPHGEWKYLSPEALLRPERDVHLRCPGCGHRMTKQERCTEGRWRALDPAVTSVRGYRVPALCFPFVSLARFAANAVSTDPSEIQEFYRSDLGQAYTPSGSQITEAMLAALSDDLPNGQLPESLPWRDTVMGVDIGGRFHFTIDSLAGTEQRPYVRAMGYVTDWAGLDQLMSQYQIRMCVIDSQPEDHATREFSRRWPGRVFRGHYPAPTAMHGQLYRRAYDPIEPLITTSQQSAQQLQRQQERQERQADPDLLSINRTMALDGLFSAVADRTELWPTQFTRDPEIIGHLKASVRVVTQDQHGQEVAQWVHTAPDHWAHACFRAGTMIQTEHGPQPIEHVQIGTMVWTRRGLRRVTSAWCTNPSAQVHEYRFSDGSILVATPNHPVHTRERGFVPLDALVYADTISTWASLKRSNIGASPTVVIQIRHAGRIGSTTRRVGHTERMGRSVSTSRSGKTPTARSPMGAWSTIATRTRSTTTHPTSLASHGTLTPAGIWRVENLTWTTWPGYGRFHTHGERRPKGSSGIGSMRLIRSRNERSGHIRAAAAERASKRLRWETNGTQPGAPVATAVMRQHGERAAWMTRSGPALSAEEPTGSTATERRGSVRADAPSGADVHLASKRQLGYEAVFNLSVDEAEEYYANGLLVHNCVYARAARAMLPRAISNGSPLAGGVRTLLRQIEAGQLAAGLSPDGMDPRLGLPIR